MNKTLFIVLGCSLMLPSYVMASASTTWQTAANGMTGSIKTGVDTDSKSTTRPTYNAGNFIIKSSLAGLGNGTHEYDKIYTVIAEKRYENGACLKPVQISCYADAGWKDDTSLTRYATASTTACQTFCAEGYSGSECKTKTSDTTDQTTAATNSWAAENYTFSGYAGDTDYESNTLSKAMYLYAHKYYNTQEADILLGVTKYLTNGVLVAPISVVCGSRRKKKDDHIFVKIQSESSGEILLCSDGYVPNTDKTDCVAKSDKSNIPGVVVQNEDGSFTKETEETTISLYDSLKAKPGFDESIHQIVNTGSTLAIACKNDLYGFASADSLKCEECITENSKKSGISKQADGIGYGVCVRCQTGQIFDSTTNKCETAIALSKSDMQYGLDEATKGNAVINQCWTKSLDPDEYKQCVLSDGKSDIKTQTIDLTSLKTKKLGYYTKPDSGTSVSTDINIDSVGGFGTMTNGYTFEKKVLK